MATPLFHDGLTVHTQSHDYPIVITENSCDKKQAVWQSKLHPYIGGRQVLIVTNDTVAPLYLKALEEELSRAIYRQGLCAVQMVSNIKTRPVSIKFMMH